MNGQRSRDGRHVIELRGDFDVASERPFLDAAEQVLADSSPVVESDMSGVEFMDPPECECSNVLRDRYRPRSVVGELSDAARSLLSMAGVLDWLYMDRPARLSCVAAGMSGRVVPPIGRFDLVRVREGGIPRAV